MSILKLAIVGSLLALAVLFWSLLAPTAPPASPLAFAVRDARVFDGEKFIARTTVVVRDGVVEAMGPDLELPVGLAVVEGKGRTLLPGFIDAHVHTWGDARRDALRFGVTTELDMFSDPARLPAAKQERASLAATAQADPWSAGMLATAPGGHGTQFGMAIDTLTSPSDAPAWVRARQAEGSDYIKIVREDLHVYSTDHDLPSLDDKTAAAVIDAAHAAGLKAVVHASAQQAARESLRDGADGLVHVFQDTVADDAMVALARDKAVFVVPTLSVIAAFSGRKSGLAEDPRVLPFLSPDQRQTLAASVGFSAANPALLANARQSVRRLHAAGVPILAGTDAPNPGTAHGVSLHDEIILLHDAGLAPAAALAAATSVPADAFGIADRGRIAPGLRADLVLVEGNPETDLASTRAIARIWKNGRDVDRRVPATEVPVLGSGPVSHFDGAQLDSRVGSGWSATSDRMAGGQSDARVERIDGGAGGSAGAMRVSGEVRAGGTQVWAGAFFNPGDQIMQAVDARGRGELVFQVRGDGRTLNVLVFSGEQGGAPAVQSVATTPAWTEVRLPLAGFAGWEAGRLRAVAVTTAEPSGPFQFDLDGFEIR